jgi:hypothetical protein
VYTVRVYPWHVTGENYLYTKPKRVLNKENKNRKGNKEIRINRGFNSLQSQEKKK